MGVEVVNAAPDAGEDLRRRTDLPRSGNGRAAKSDPLSVLDALRGAAATYVVGNHASVLLLIGWAQAKSLGMPLPVRLASAASLIFAFGHQAVVLFFVLSGFVIHLRQARRLTPESITVKPFEFRVGDYLWRRIRRIVPPFYFALLLTAVLDAAVRALGPGFAAPHTGSSFADDILVQHNGIKNLLGNMLFLQWIAFPTWGNDTPLWSLAYEFYLYLLYPIYIAVRLRAGAARSIGVVAAVSAVAIGLMLRHNTQQPVLMVLSYWMCWVMGCWAAEAYVGRFAVPKALLSAPLLGVAALAWLGTAHRLPMVISDNAGSLICALALLAAISYYARSAGSRFDRAAIRPMAAVGKFSYSLYLVHVPVLSVLWALWYRTHNAMPTNPVLFVIGIGVALVAGSLSYRLVESRFVTKH